MFYCLDEKEGKGKRERKKEGKKRNGSVKHERLYRIILGRSQIGDASLYVCKCNEIWPVKRVEQ